MESVFGIVIDGWIGQLEFLKRNAIKDDFSDNFPKFLVQLFQKTRRCTSGCCQKYHVQITELWSSTLLKKTFSLDLP